jgi:hypothetical protein
MSAEQRRNVDFLSLQTLRGAPDFRQYCHATTGERMRDDNGRKVSWLPVLLRDVQFWVPVAVLIGGLLVLRWIS